MSEEARPGAVLIVERCYEPDEEAIARAVAILLREPRDDGATAEENAA